MANDFISQLNKAANLEDAARALGHDPEALANFEKQYANEMLTRPETDDNNILSHLPFLNRKKVPTTPITKEDCELAQGMAYAIALRLAGDTEAPEITPDDVKTLPKEIAPQLTHDAMRYDMRPGSADAVILSTLARAANTTDEKEKAFLLAHARQGLDICDIDPLIYEMLSADPASIGHWIGPLTKAVNATEGIEIPKTTIRKVPAPILQLSRTLEPETLTQATRDIVNLWTRIAFNLKDDEDYFVKTGTFSSKYDFRNARVNGEEIAELGEYLLYLSYQAATMAGPLTQPTPIIGVSTTNEWVVREYVTSTDDIATIYHGLPLRVEFRCFIDFDKHELLGVIPYWDPETMTTTLTEKAQHGDPDAAHDLISFMAWWETASTDFDRLAPKVSDIVSKLINNGLDELGGQWSLDIMRTTDDNGNEHLWAIDMAPAYRSALKDKLDDPSRLIDTGEPDWIAALPA